MSSVTLNLQENIKRFERKQLIVSLFGLFIIFGSSIIINRVFIQATAEQTAKLITRMAEKGYFQEIELTLQSAKLDYFHQIQFQSKALNIDFTFPPLAEYFSKKSFFDSFLYETVKIIPSFSMLTSAKSDVILFEYNRFRLIPYALLVWIILNLVSIPQTRLIKKRTIKQFENDLELSKKTVQAEVSRKVRHNITTPLSALMAMSGRLDKLGRDDRELFNSIVCQIKDLVQDLDMSNVKATDNLVTMRQEIISIYQLIKECFYSTRIIGAEKFEIEVVIQESLVSAKANLIPHEFKAIINNLVSNAMEASNDGEKIILTAKDLSNRVEIKIKDFGKGIPSELIDKVLEKDFTFGKENGSGLGLYHAKSYLNAWGGTLKIDSIENIGTEVTIIFPLVDRAKWHTPRIKIKSDQTIVVLDDQKSQHQVWDLKLVENGFKGQIRNFQEPEEFIQYQKSNILNKEDKDFIFLFDYDLGLNQPNGLDLLNEIPDRYNRYLVTGHYDDLEIQKLCEQFGVYLLPKVEISNIPIVC